MSKKYKSDAIEAIHETTHALQDVCASGKQTMRHFDDAYLMPSLPLQPQQVKLSARDNYDQMLRHTAKATV